MGLRLAQFGGVGGQYAPNSPGGSPMFQGGQSGYAGYAQNNFSGDIPMDDLMGRYRKSDILGFERPLESLLEIFHESLEQDAIPYLLDFDERVKLDRKRKIRTKEQYIKDLSDGKFLPEQNKKIEEKLQTVEQMLADARQNDNVDFSKLARTKLSAYRRRPGTLPLVDEILPTEEEYKDSYDNQLADARLSEPFTGIAPVYEFGEGVDSYINKLNNQNFPDNHNMQNSTLLINFPEESQTFHNYQGTLNPEPSPITPESKANNISLEGKLEKLKKSPKGIGRLDPDMFYGLDWDEKLRGRYPQRGITNEGPYTNDTMGGYSTNDYPFNSNNPYFGVLD